MLSPISAGPVLVILSVMSKHKACQNSLIYAKDNSTADLQVVYADCLPQTLSSCTA